MWEIKFHTHIKQHHMTLSSQCHLSFSRRSVHIIHHSSPPSCRQNISLCNKIVSTNTYGGTTPQKISLFQIFWKSQNFENSIFFGPPFLGSVLGSCPFFQYSPVAWDLTTADVSTTFPPSFFTVMPKGLTTGPEFMSDWTCPLTTYVLDLKNGKTKDYVPNVSRHSLNLSRS